MTIPQAVAMSLNILGLVMFAFGLVFSFLGEASNAYLSTIGALTLWSVCCIVFAMGEIAKK